MSEGWSSWTQVIRLTQTQSMLNCILISLHHRQAKKTHFCRHDNFFCCTNKAQEYKDTCRFRLKLYLRLVTQEGQHNMQAWVNAVLHILSKRAAYLFSQFQPPVSGKGTNTLHSIKMLWNKHPTSKTVLHPSGMSKWFSTPISVHLTHQQVPEPEVQSSLTHGGRLFKIPVFKKSLNPAIFAVCFIPCALFNANFWANFLQWSARRLKASSSSF